jgi:6-phosphogluconolactonase/glucosamine-6-phosphate isomerase/deaminase
MLFNAFNWYNSEEEWSKSVLDYIQDVISRLASQNCRSINLALAGGSTPFGIYTELARQLSAASSTPEISLFLTDERDVPLTHSDSNGGKISEIFNAFNTILFDPLEINAEREYRSKIEERLTDRGGAFDLILLGMGEDGHIASLFPEKMRWPEPNQTFYKTDGPRQSVRYTLALSSLIKARNVGIIIGNQPKKHEIIQQLKEKNPSVMQLPVYQLLEMRKSSVHWFIHKRDD